MGDITAQRPAKTMGRQTCQKCADLPKMCRQTCQKCADLPKMRRSAKTWQGLSAVVPLPSLQSLAAHLLVMHKKEPGSLVSQVQRHFIIGATI
jgi:hypothetical protein